MRVQSEREKLAREERGEKGTKSRKGKEVVESERNYGEEESLNGRGMWDERRWMSCEKDKLAGALEGEIFVRGELRVEVEKMRGRKVRGGTRVDLNTKRVPIRRRRGERLMRTMSARSLLMKNGAILLRGG